jgi:aminomethyltransferase
MAISLSLAEQLHAARDGAAVGRVGPVDVWRLTGPDHRDALDRIVSQDVGRLAAGEGRLALLLAPKGQFRARMAVCGGRDELLLLAPPGRGDALASGLATYLRFSRCTLAPAIGGGSGLIVVGPGWREAAAAAGADEATLSGGGACRVGDGAPATLWLGHTFLGVPGAIAVTDAAALQGLEVSLIAADAVPAGREALDLIRVRAGFPAWGAELTDTVLPPEVGLDGSAISYTKGCYVGQETIARMKTYGRPNRRLVSVRLVEGPATRPELPLPLTAAGEEKPRATLTSWGLDPELGGIGLALARREIAAAGTRLHGGNRTFEIVEELTAHS